jgi:uncharacterized protein
VTLWCVVLLIASTVLAQSEMPWTKVKCQREQRVEMLNTVPFGTDPQSRLIRSITRCEYEDAQALIASGMDLNFKDANGRSPLLVAIEFGENNIIQAILKQGVDPNRAPRQNYPLIVAASSGNAEAVKLLLDYGAKPNSNDLYKGTALMYASQRGRLDVVKLLLENGADPRMRDKFGLTARDSAVRARHGVVAEVLRVAEEKFRQSR